MNVPQLSRGRAQPGQSISASKREEDIPFTGAGGLQVLLEGQAPPRSKRVGPIIDKESEAPFFRRAEANQGMVLGRETRCERGRKVERPGELRRRAGVRLAASPRPGLMRRGSLDS